MTIAPKRKKRSVFETAGMVDAMDETFTVGTFYDPRDLKARLEDFEPLLVIDKDGLDEALQRQPDLFYRVSRILTLQISRRDAAKQFLANQEALVDAQLRRNARTAKDRILKDEIEAQKRVNSKVVAAVDQLLKMNHAVMQWTNLKDSVVQRGHALREMVSLYVNEYWTSAGSVTINRMREQRAAGAGRSYRRD